MLDRKYDSNMAHTHRRPITKRPEPTAVIFVT